ncbi:MAG: lasso RiPP family leader peptide-containing protein [Candidatus Polarisedimenticolaceae bacterium]|nr:lasso RiPP family leader peptide-containing protein [Candidatus Polarisedimenticolaceae bacterium]
MKKQTLSEHQSIKKPYHPPILEKAGTLQELTQGLGTSMVDSQGQPKTGGFE